MLAVLAVEVRAEPGFSLCTEDVPELPLSNPDPNHPGPAQQLIAMTARYTQITIRPISATWQTCQNLLKEGKVDALNIVGYAGININLGVFPMKDGKLDTSKALGTIPTTLFRRVGTDVDFVKCRFVNLKTPVGVLNSYQVNSLNTGKEGGIVDDKSYTVQSLARRLAAGKLDLIAADASLVELVNKNYAGKLEPLAHLLANDHYFLVFSPIYYSANKKQVEAFWNELARVRQSAEYNALIKSNGSEPKPGQPSSN